MTTITPGTSNQDQSKFVDTNNTTMATWAGAIARALKQAGVDPQLLLSRHGIDPELVHNPQQRIPVAVMTRFWEAAVDASGDPAFGLQVARQVNMSTFYALGVAAMTSENISQAADMICRFASIVSDGIDMRYTQSAEEMSLLLDFRPGFPRFADPCIEAMFAAIVLIARQIFPDEAAPSKICFRHRCHTDPAIYRAFFACPVYFCAAQDGLHVRTEKLPAGPLPTSSPGLARVNAELCQQYQQWRQQGTVSQQIRDALWTMLERRETPTLAGLAKRMAMSERKLQRQLSNEGQQFRLLLDSVRADMAKQLLQTGHLSLSRVAEQLGFDSVSAFSRACKRWSGYTPGQLRQQDRQSPAAGGTA